jgi:uncharacterized membrane protein YbhN (UPF0104 family)
LVARAHVGAFLAVLLHINPWWAALGLGMAVLGMVLSAWQWQILLRNEGINASLALCTGLYFVGMAFGQLLPSSVGGDVAKALYVARLFGRGVGAAGATLMSRVIGLLVLLLTALPVSLLAYRFVPGVVGSLTAILAVATGVYVVALAVLFLSPTLLARASANRVARFPVGRKLVDLSLSLAQYKKQPRIFASAALVSALFYLASDLNFYCFGQALHLRSPFWFYCIAIPVTSLATLLPISLNGYGIRGASFVLAFGLIGETGAASLALASAMELQMLVFAVVGGLVALVVNRFLLRPAALATPLPDAPAAPLTLLWSPTAWDAYQRGDSGLQAAEEPARL